MSATTVLRARAHKTLCMKSLQPQLLRRQDGVVVQAMHEVRSKFTARTQAVQHLVHPLDPDRHTRSRRSWSLNMLTECTRYVSFLLHIVLCSSLSLLFIICVFFIQRITRERRLQNGVHLNIQNRIGNQATMISESFEISSPMLSKHCSGGHKCCFRRFKTRPQAFMFWSHPP